MSNSLWGDEFEVVQTPVEAKKIIKKIATPKKPKQTVERAVKSKSVSLDDKLAIIRENVIKILGRYSSNTVVIKSYEEFKQYIDQSIKSGIIAIDTETNNSVDPVTCKIMGLCLYTPGGKNAYIPINHINKETGERYSWQVTEKQVNEQLQRVSSIDTVMHNGKFDYSVIKCTCGVCVHITWDTLIGAKCLDENERSAGLKQQYIDKIDSSVEKYSIDHLFEDIPYEVVDPEIFALYAATDSYMTYQLYLWQKKQFELPGNERLYNMFKTIEMPLVEVLAEMEMAGMEVDQEYGKLLSAKYHKKLDEVDKQIEEEMLHLQPKIDAWRLTDDANSRELKKPGDPSSGYKKSKNEQLTTPLNFSSPTQLAILFYDILKAPIVDKKQPRGTGEDALVAIAEKLNLPICNLLIKRRELVKLLSTYIDAIPQLALRWPDHRVRTHFNQYGAATGRLSSSEPINFQNIPSHNKEIRMLFKAKSSAKLIEGENNTFVVSPHLEIETTTGWVRASNLREGMQLVFDSGVGVIKKIDSSDNNYVLYVG